MTVHLFNATSSFGCSNFGLKQEAKDYANVYGQHVAEFLHENSQEARDLVKECFAMCAKGV